MLSAWKLIAWIKLYSCVCIFRLHTFSRFLCYQFFSCFLFTSRASQHSEESAFKYFKISFSNKMWFRLGNDKYLKQLTFQLKSSISLDMTPCSPLEGNRRFGKTCSRACHLLLTGLSPDLFFVPEDGSDVFSVFYPRTRTKAWMSFRCVLRSWEQFSSQSRHLLSQKTLATHVFALHDKNLFHCTSN
jgi:hypothetical protein